MFCTNCGSQIAAGGFCANCGQQASPAQATQAAPPTNQVPPTGPYAAPYGSPYGAPPKTNGMAIAALVVGLAGCGFNFLGIIFGIIANNQIKASNGTQTGQGMATAGIVLGALSILGVIIYFGSLSSIGYY